MAQIDSKESKSDVLMLFPPRSFIPEYELEKEDIEKARQSYGFRTLRKFSGPQIIFKNIDEALKEEDVNERKRYIRNILKSFSDMIPAELNNKNKRFTKAKRVTAEKDKEEIFLNMIVSLERGKNFQVSELREQINAKSELVQKKKEANLNISEDSEEENEQSSQSSISKYEDSDDEGNSEGGGRDDDGEDYD